MNGADLANFRGLAQGALESLFPCSLKVPADAGQTYTAARGRLAKAFNLTIENFAEDFQLGIRIQTSLLVHDGVIITPEQTEVLVDNIRYRVARIATQPNDPATYLALKQL